MSEYIQTDEEREQIKKAREKLFDFFEEVKETDGTAPVEALKRENDQLRAELASVKNEIFVTNETLANYRLDREKLERENDQLRAELAAYKSAPKIWVVVGADKDPIYCADRPDACHEHINDMISDDIDGASDCVVRRAIVIENKGDAPL